MQAEKLLDCFIVSGKVPNDATASLGDWHIIQGKVEMAKETYGRNIE
jgi:hypothetical protein